MTIATSPEVIDEIVEVGNDDNGGATKVVREMPSWGEEFQDEWGVKVIVSEWEEEDNIDQDNDTGYRLKNGWKGKDLIHDKNAPVRITDYFVKYGDGKGIDGLDKGGVDTTLTGIVHFTNRAESHQGYCHGGSMCSVLDDVVGWCSFMVTGQCIPWSGFTVQINTSLKKPIIVNSILLVVAVVTKIERRKIYIESKIINPQEECIYAFVEGLVVLNRGVLPGLSTRASLDSWPSSNHLS